MSQRTFSHPFAIVCFLLTVAVSGLFCLDRASAQAALPLNSSPGDSARATIQAASAASNDIAYVPLSSSDALSLIDTQTHSTIGTIDLAQYGCDYPRRARLNPDGDELYVICSYGNIVVLETTNLSPVAIILFDHHTALGEITFVQGGDYALLSNGYDDGVYYIDVIDTATHTIIQTIPTSGYVTPSIAAHPYLPLAYAAGTQGPYDGGVLVIDTESFNVQTIIPYGGYYGGELLEVQVSPDGQWVYASGYWESEGGGTIKIDVSTNTIVDTLSGYIINDLAISPDGSNIYAHQDYGHEILVIDPETLDVITSIYPPNYTSESQISCDGSELYAVGTSNTVSVFDTQTYSLTYEILLPGNGTRYGFALCPQYTVEGILLTPPSQSELGKVGETVTYTLELLNVTGVTDSFDLEVLPGNTWTTSLSAAQVGPLANGESIAVTASVEVPPMAQWEESDIATIQASSVTSPSISATSIITTTATGWELAYVPLDNIDSLALVDTQTHTTIGNIDLAQYGCGGSQRVRLTPDGTELYVMCEPSDNIIILETANLSLIATIPFADTCHDHDVAFVQDGAYALISKGYYCSVNLVDVIDTTTHTIFQSIPTPGYQISSIAAHPYLPLAYAAGTDYSDTPYASVFVIDTNSFTIQTIIPFGGLYGGELWDMQISPDGQWVYAGGSWTYEDGGLVKIEVSTNTVVDTLTGYRIYDLNISPDGSKLYVHDDNYGYEIFVIDADTLDYITSIIVEHPTYESELTCDGSELYLSSYSNSVGVVDTQTYIITYDIPLPAENFGGDIAVCPQYMSPPGAYLFPPSQDEFARAGETLTYTLQMLNLTGMTDSFDLQVLPGNTWTTTLSSAQVGPLADGESVTVIAWVEAPAGAQPVDSDIATIQATSVTSPTVYTDTASLDTLVLGEELAFVTLQFSHTVAIVDVATQAVVENIYVSSAGCNLPWRATMSPDGASVYVACTASSNVLVIDTDTLKVVANISEVPLTTDVVFTRSGNYVLAGSVLENQIAVIDTGTLTVSQTIPTSSLPYSLVMHPYLELAYVTTSGGEVLVLDTNTFTVVDSIYVGSMPWDVAVSPDGAWVFADDQSGGNFWVIDAATNSLYTTITALGNLTGVEVSSDGAYIYVGGEDGVWVIDGHTFTPITNIILDDGALELELTGDESQLYAGTSGGDVAVIDPTNFTVSGFIPMIGQYSFGIAIHPEYIGRAVFLEPADQTKQGGRGQVVEHIVNLTNFTLITDTFSLSLGASAWGTSLSTDVIGPLPDGGTASFSIYVTVPPDAPWYASDTVTVTAGSLASPGVYTATAQASTVAYALPQISVDPSSLESVQFPDEVTTQTLTISNGAGVTLTYEIFEGTYPGKLIGDVAWLSTEPVSGSLPTDSSVPVQVTFDATNFLPDMVTTTLFIESNDPLLPLLSIPVTLTVMEPQAGLAITPTEAASTGSPGETVTYTFTLTNLGDVADSFTLEVSGTWTATLPVTVTGELGVGETFTFLLYATIPLEAEDGAQDVVLITATSANDPLVTASANATTTAEVPPVEIYVRYLPLVYKK